MESAELKPMTTILAAASMIMLSALIHSPWSFPPIYSDIVSFWARDWLAEGHPPYLVGDFEYPLLSGLLIYLCRVVGDTLEGYYVAFAAISVAFFLSMTWSLAKLIEREKLLMYVVFAPSILFYGVYNFDLFGSTLLLLSLHAFIADKKTLSAILLALSTLTKLFGVLALPPLLLEEGDRKRRVKYLSIFTASVGIPCLLLHLAAPNAIPYFFKYHAEWGLENAWYGFLFPEELGWGAAKVFALLLAIFTLVEVYASRLPLFEKIFLAFAFWLLATYVYTPQMNLWLLPLIALISRDLTLFHPWELVNAAIILTWFTVPDPTKPWTPPQTAALLRAGLLAAMAAQTILPRFWPTVKFRELPSLLTSITGRMNRGGACR